MKRLLVVGSYLVASFVGAWIALELVDRLLGGHGPRVDVV